MNQEATNGFKAYVTSMPAIVLYCLALVAACAPGNPQTPSSTAPQGQKSAPSPPAPIELNADPMGTTAEPSPLSKRLQEVFAQRLANHAYARGMEQRTDLPESERIERTVFVKADRSIKLGTLTKVIEAIEGAGAQPLLLPIEVEG